MLNYYKGVQMKADRYFHNVLQLKNLEKKVMKAANGKFIKLTLLCKNRTSTSESSSVCMHSIRA
ncbi:hypothetical protein KIN20_023255 [Parelaphostrongylus tenuis]|uniref:Uncharacterized protein n=1 Tax=Parelaphostrongylus tenuis TaxID=148309 RepID=A0AAD5N6Z1_PARTN|nr:hypothetical protein KIN20_023255 [Parelaphostrongylus tenuis]